MKTINYLITILIILALFPITTRAQYIPEGMDVGDSTGYVFYSGTNLKGAISFSWDLSKYVVDFSGLSGNGTNIFIKENTNPFTIVETIPVPSTSFIWMKVIVSGSTKHIQFYDNIGCFLCPSKTISVTAPVAPDKKILRLVNNTFFNAAGTPTTYIIGSDDFRDQVFQHCFTNIETDHVGIKKSGTNVIIRHKGTSYQSPQLTSANCTLMTQNLPNGHGNLGNPCPPAPPH